MTLNIKNKKWIYSIFYEDLTFLEKIKYRIQIRETSEWTFSLDFWWENISSWYKFQWKSLKDIEKLSENKFKNEWENLYRIFESIKNDIILEYHLNEENNLLEDFDDEFKENINFEEINEKIRNSFEIRKEESKKSYEDPIEFWECFDMCYWTFLYCKNTKWFSDVRIVSESWHAYVQANYKWEEIVFDVVALIQTRYWDTFKKVEDRDKNDAYNIWSIVEFYDEFQYWKERTRCNIEIWDQENIDYFLREFKKAYDWIF